MSSTNIDDLDLYPNGVPPQVLQAAERQRHLEPQAQRERIIALLERIATALEKEVA